MARLDKQKEIISYLKTGFFFFLGTLFGIVAYLFNKFEVLSNTKLIILNIAIFLDIVILIFIAKKSKQKIDEIEEI